MTLAITFSTAVFFLIMVVAVIANRAIYADGSNYLLMVTSTENFFNEDTSSNPRICAHILTQPLVVLALKLGMRDFKALGLVYSLNCYLIPFLSLLACLKLLRDKRYAIFPILSYLFGTLQVYGFINCEAHVMVALYWPLFLTILEWDEMTISKAFTLPIIALLSLDCYESALFLSALTLVLLMINVARNGFTHRAHWVFTAVLLVAGVFLAFKSILAAAGGANEGSFLDSYRSLVRYDIHLYLLAALLAVSFVIEKFRCRQRVVWTLAITVFSLAAVFYSLHPHWLRILETYRFRIALLIFPFFLGLAAAGIKFWRFESVLERRWIWNAVVLMAAYFLAVQICCSFQWYGYQQLFRSYLLTTHDRGMIEYHETPFVQGNDGSQLIYEQNWNWTFPVLSIILAQDGQINTLVYVKGIKSVSFPLDSPPSFNAEFHVEYNYLKDSVPKRP